MNTVELERFHRRHTLDILQNATESGLIGCFPANNKEQFEHRLFSLLNGTFSEFFILSISHACKGCIYGYEHKPDDLHMKVALESQSLKATERLEAWKLFLQILFKRYPLKKVFYETTEGVDFERQLKPMGFKRELTLPSARYIKGAYRDLDIFSCYREDFYDEGLSTL